ncbi:Uncharacterised protein [Serratia quinivorans]|nr:Uncharacterised protein [Serratia quinivorans]CAI1656228.1 Uncharacterised protein [Serratia quinivorans]
MRYMLDFHPTKLSYFKRMGRVLPLACSRAALIMNSDFLLLSLGSLILLSRVFNGSNFSCPFHIPKIKGSFNAERQYMVYI